MSVSSAAVRGREGKRGSRKPRIWTRSPWVGSHNSAVCALCSSLPPPPPPHKRVAGRGSPGIPQPSARAPRSLNTGVTVSSWCRVW